jgi:UDP-glucuronate decarboxylase
MRLFITGATGYIGRHLMALLPKDEVDVAILLSSDKVNLFANAHRIIGRLETISNWQQQLIDWKPDACIHLAWYAEPGQYLYSPLNIALLQQSLHLMQVLIQAQCQHVMMVGTCAEYNTEFGYLSENSPTQPTTIYATAKLSLMMMARQMAFDAKIQFTWARMFYLYGSHEDERRLVPALIKQLLRDEVFQTTQGEQVRDYLHVVDAASALWHLVQQHQSGIYNISSGYPITIRNLIEMIADILDAKHLLEIGAIPYRQWEPMFICGNNTKLRETGWKPQYTLQSGLEQTVAWWQQ